MGDGTRAMTHGLIRAIRSASPAREAAKSGQHWEHDTRHGTRIDKISRPERGGAVGSLGVPGNRSGRTPIRITNLILYRGSLPVNTALSESVATHRFLAKNYFN